MSALANTWLQRRLRQLARMFSPHARIRLIALLGMVLATSGILSLLLAAQGTSGHGDHPVQTSRSTAIPTLSTGTPDAVSASQTPSDVLPTPGQNTPGTDATATTTEIPGASPSPAATDPGNSYPTPTLTATIWTPTATATPVPVYPQLSLGVSVSFPSGSFQNLNTYIQEAGKAPATVMVFKDWGSAASGPFYAFQFNDIVALGATPLVSWMPRDPSLPNLSQPAYTLANITAGNFDTYIHQWAQAIKAWGKTLYMRLAPEMNGTWFPWSPGVNGNSSGAAGGAEYVAMWQHVVTIFRTDGATNVRWVWSVNVGNESSIPTLYPSDGYVDWVGITGYNFGSPWNSLAQVYASTYPVLEGLTSKPFMITETGCPESGGDKAGWIRQGLLSDLPTRFPRILAVIWFDWGDFSIDTSPAALAAYQQVVQSYQGRQPS